MKKYNCLIIGAGRQGAFADAPGSDNEEKIISFAHAFKKHSGFNLCGFYDIDTKKAEEAAILWKTDYWSGYPIGIDVIVIATSDENHYEPLKKALERKPKLVICEKPLCMDLSQAREIVKLYEEKALPLMVNYTRCFQPYHNDLKRKYELGEYGKLINYFVKYNRGLLHTGSHAVNFLDWLFGLENLPDGLKLTEVKTDYRVWQVELFFEHYHWREELIGDQPVWSYYNNSVWHVVNNAYEFLEGRETLKCDARDALKTLEACQQLKERKNEFG